VLVYAAPVSFFYFPSFPSVIIAIPDFGLSLSISDIFLGLEKPVYFYMSSTVYFFFKSWFFYIEVIISSSYSDYIGISEILAIEGFLETEKTRPASDMSYYLFIKGFFSAFKYYSISIALKVS